MRRSPLVPVAVLMIAALVALSGLRAEKPASEADAAVERTRKQVRMLDDLYKTSIVLVTDAYVNEDSDLAAGSAFQKLFATMKEKGWHEVRLLDATGEPYDDDNTPREEFEKQAVAQLKAGKAFVDEVIDRDGARFLRAATPVPVVMQKCVMCHPHYAQAKEGAAIGALAYTVPIE